MRLIALTARFSAAATALALSLCAQAFAADAPAISGMALIEGTTNFLVVHDSKAGQNLPAVGIMAYNEDGGMSYSTLSVDWPARPSNDLESISAVPDRPGEFLLAESGSWTDRSTGELHPGRIFHVRMAQQGESTQIVVLATLTIPEELHEIEGHCIYIEPADQVEPWEQEGLDIEAELRQLQAQVAGVPVEETESTEPEKQVAARHVLVLGTRGGAYPYEPGFLHRYEVKLAESWIATEPIQQPEQVMGSRLGQGAPWARSITDLYLDNNQVLWISSATDPGDWGPFESGVTRYGKLIGTDYYYGGGAYYGSPNVGWSVSGVKIEALGAPFTQGAVLSYGTDDEGYGGLIRPLGPGRDNSYWY